ncbi:hypothetical protein H1P_1530009 [Hyella patelloides LEGE 07179]|uniref:Transposase n=1 Tax=Hyella patelloides LEGE 07179 TaxID=945734 RepID=A0A563VMG5_9CYAN|nr:hypothetical protein H1P_1530009 [Hyella patelloides LEGE 07179]
MSSKIGNCAELKFVIHHSYKNESGLTREEINIQEVSDRGLAMLCS